MQRIANIHEALRALAPGMRQLCAGDEGIEPYAHDESAALPVAPELVVFPRSTEETARVLAYCHRERVPVVPRGGGTGKAGGAVPIPGGLVLSTEALAGPAQISTHDRLAVVGAGAALHDLKAAVEGAGLYYPPDPSSASGCTIGGNVATNAAGPACVKYGPTRDYVYALTAVLADGRVLHSGHRTRKSASGLDITALLTGSEGTLAVITEVTLRLLPHPGGAATVWLSFPQLAETLAASEKIIASGLQPRMLELLDSAALDALRRFADGRLPSADGWALIVELEGTPASLDEQLRSLVAAVPSVTPSFVAKSSVERAEWRRLRGQTSVVLKRVRGQKYSEDVAVPLSQLETAVTKIRSCAAAHEIDVACYGHVGDGNLHVNLLYDSAPRERILRVADEIFAIVLDLGGTLSGEHGIGSLKQHLLSRELGPEMVALQRQIKAIFDPREILNPGRALAD